MTFFSSEVELFTDTDAVFAGFCSGCFAANCPLAHNCTASELQDTIYNLLETLKYNPVPLFISGVGFVLDYSTVKSLIFTYLYTPSTWPVVATLLDTLISGDIDALSVLLGPVQAANPVASKEAEVSIKCSDKFARSSNQADVLPEILARHQKSKIGGDTADFVEEQCAQWKLPAKERYGGDFQVQTKNPLLIIGNTYDPVTPLVSARNVSSGFEGSVLLQHNGYGVRSDPTPFLPTSSHLLTAYLSKASLALYKKGYPGLLC